MIIPPHDPAVLVVANTIGSAVPIAINFPPFKIKPSPLLGSAVIVEPASNVIVTPKQPLRNL
jgi:hypothetical protein